MRCTCREMGSNPAGLARLPKFATEPETWRAPLSGIPNLRATGNLLKGGQAGTRSRYGGASVTRAGGAGAAAR
jgi:hypothetical protein